MVIKSAKLKKGDCVAVISPSWGGPSVFPHIFDNGLRVLKERFGLKIKEFPTARMNADKLDISPQIRAEDINDAFADKEVKAIITSIGGDDSIRIIKYLDKKLIKRNPKIFMGYSDTTMINTYINQLGLVTFNGPSVMAGFSQMENFPESEKHVKDLLFENPTHYDYKPYSEWSMKYKDWSDKNNVGKIENKQKNRGWHWIQGEKSVEEELFGGCIEIFEMMKGTEFWPKKSFWKNKILFLETSEDKPTPDYVKFALRSYGIAGIFDQIKALVVGRARDYNEEENKKLEENILKIIKKEFKHPEMPIITNVDFGHTDPQIILPLGIKAKIDCKKRTFSLVEKPLKD